MNKQKTQNKQTILIITLALLILVSANMATAQFMPLAVEGTVFNLDGSEQAPAGTAITIHDITSGYYIEGQIGTFNNPGKYAASISGNPGDIVIITASNDQDSTSVTITLEGSMHNINLYLNTTQTTSPPTPNNPPNITSTPITQAYTGQLYQYDVEATDPEQDFLIYSLAQNPSGMIIDSGTGLIEWIPTIFQWGSHDITLYVTDENNNTAIQEFTLEVSLSFFPEINFTEIYNSSDEIIIEIYPSIPYAFTASEILEGLEIQHSESNPITILINEDYDFDDEQEDEDHEDEQEIYKYLEIRPLSVISSSIENATIEFKVEKSWLLDEEVIPENISLKRFVNSQWQELQTEIYDNDSTYYYYQSNTNGLGILAISGEESEEYYTSTSYSLPFFIIGTVFERDNNPSFEGTPIKITNENTGAEINIHTSMGPMPGAYATIIPGKKGDLIKITPNNNEEASYTFELEKRENKIDFKKKLLSNNYKVKHKKTKKSLFSFFKDFFNL